MDSVRLRHCCSMVLCPHPAAAGLCAAARALKPLSVSSVKMTPAVARSLRTCARFQEVRTMNQQAVLPCAAAFAYPTAQIASGSGQ